MAPSFARFPLLDWADKRAIVRALLTIARSGGRPADLSNDSGGVTMLAWLQRHRQTERAIRRFWEVILVSALDEELDRTDARYGIDVFWKAFLSTRGGYRVGIPCVPSESSTTAAGKRLSAEREVLLRAGVRGFLVTGNRVEGVERDNGSVEAADYYLAAVRQDVLPELLPAMWWNVSRCLRTCPLANLTDHGCSSLVR